MARRMVAVCVMLFLTGACEGSSPTGATNIDAQYSPAGPGPTLLVTNATCSPGPCVPFEVRAGIPRFTVPQPSGGVVSLGWVDSTTACLRFPASWTLTVIGPGGDTTKITWRPSDSIWLIVPRLANSTVDFVPASAPGWSITFPNGQGGARLTPSQTCRS